MNRCAALACAALLLSAPAAQALSLAEIGERDFNGNGAIDRGRELDALKQVFPSLTAEQKTTLAIFDDSGAPSVEVSNFRPLAPSETPDKRCKEHKSFVLQESVSDISLYQNDFVAPSKKGALFSLRHDSLNDVTSWEVKGAMAWVPRGFIDRCVLDTAPGHAALSGYGIAPFLSFEGKGDSDNEGTSNLSFGLLAQFQVFGGSVFNLQEFSIAPFYRTDFQGDAEIYGLSALWVPYHFTSRLNGLQGDAGRRQFDWKLSAGVDYLKVDKAGNSGLTEDTEYGFVGLNLGLGYTFENRLRLDAGVEAARDLVNNISAIKYTASARVPLSDDNRTWLELAYQEGRDKATLQDVEGVTLNLRLAF